MHTFAITSVWLDKKPLTSVRVFGTQEIKMNICWRPVQIWVFALLPWNLLDY